MRTVIGQVSSYYNEQENKMFISNNPKIVFVAIPKTGTRTMYNVLKEYFNGSLYMEHHQIIPPQYNDYFSFCTIRNPYDRVCSMWWSTSKRGLDKRNFIKEAKLRGWDNTLNSFCKLLKIRGTESDRITRTQDSFILPNRIDAMLRFDHLEEDFNKLPFVKEPINLPSLNMTKEKTGPNPNARPEWTTMVDENSIKIINSVYDKEFTATGYEMITNYAAWKKEQKNE